MLIHVIHVQILVRIVPSDHKQVAIIAKNVVAEGAHFWKLGVSFHEILFYIESEALVRPHGLIESSENQNSFVVNRHTHRQIAGCPCALGGQVDHAPHIVVDVVHLNCVGDLFLVELSSATEDIYVLIVEDATRRAVPGYIQVCNPTPGVILDVILLTRCVKALRVITSDHKYQAAFTVKGGEI